MSSTARSRRHDKPPVRFACRESPTCIGSPDTSWIEVVGELDLATAPLLDRALRDAQRDARLVVVDLGSLTFIDSSGVHVIVDNARRAREDNRRQIVVRVSAPIDLPFRLTGTVQAAEIIDLDAHEQLDIPDAAT